MQILQWHDDYSVNNDELDSHHKALFEIVNSISDCCSGADDQQYYAAIIADLEQYAICHFRSEELYMEEIGYVDIDSHIMEHNEFECRIAGMRDSSHCTDSALRSELIGFLGKWLLNHVITEDKKLTICF